MSSFDRLVAFALRQPAAPETPCPAPETLAVYLEGGLTRTEHDAVEHHASRCPRCAQHLAALVQLEDQLAAGAERDTPRRWRHRWPWLVPAAAALVAGVVWTAVPNRVMTDLSHAKTSAPAAPTPAPAGEPSPAAPPRAAAESQEALPVGEDRGLERTAPAAPAPLSGAGGYDDRLAAARAPARHPAGDAPTAAPSLPAPMLDAREPAPKVLAESLPHAMNDAGGRAEIPLAPSLPGAAPAEAAAGAADALRKDKAAHAEKDQSTARDRRAEEQPAQVIAQGAVATSPAAPDAKAAPGPARDEMTFAPALLVIPSPEPRVRWRIRGGTIERTTDEGRTWHAESVASIVGPVVGSAPSPDVCWLGGADGFVLRRDARGRWTQVSAPTTDRIVRIAATSAASATVTTAGGHTLATTDSGRTWSEPR